MSETNLDAPTLKARLQAGLLSPDRVVLAAYLGHPGAVALVGVADEDRLDPLDDDAFVGLEPSEEAPVRILVALAHAIVEPSSDARIVAGLAAVDGWLARAPEVDVDALGRHLDAILSGRFGDLSCVPECCWRIETVEAYLVAASIERLLAHAGGKAETGQPLYGSQNLREMFGAFVGFDTEHLAGVARDALLAWSLSPPG